MTKAKPIVVMTDAIAKMPAGDKRHKALKALKPAVEAALLAANGRATSFATTLHCEVAAIVRDAEHRLAATGLPRSAWTGVVVAHTGAGPTAKRYKYSAAATQVRLERRSKDWILIGAERVMVYPRDGASLNITISDAQADEIKRRSVSAFCVQKTKEATEATNAH